MNTTSVSAGDMNIAGSGDMNIAGSGDMNIAGSKATKTAGSAARNTARTTAAPKANSARLAKPAPTDQQRAVRRNQNLLLMASIGMLIASFMPWIETQLGTYTGFSSVGRFTFYLAFVGIAGGLVPYRSLAILQSALVAVAGLAFPAWQCIHLLTKVGTQGWVPGTGMLIIFASGVLAARCAIGLYRAQP